MVHRNVEDGGEGGDESQVLNALGVGTQSEESVANGGLDSR
jgi:hypothetical protein